MSYTPLPPPDALTRAPFQGKLLIDGAWVEAANGRTLERRSPAHDTLVAIYAQADVVDAERAIAAA
ncbi:MAG: sorbosone dehydrogenase, partial [Burkholderiales bacterium]|nr:sorbosone dehydrogenase [Burkholderiales bacterium]